MQGLPLLLLATTALIPLAAPALANPLGVTVVAGTVTVDGSGTPAMTITQTTDKAIIDWNSFDIGAGEITTFAQPDSSSVVLNRVTGGLGPSEIIGSLTANGQVYLVNRDGILFGKDAVIDTGALVATTHDILNRDFLAGDYRFDIPGNPSASVVNLGVITVTDGGFAALVAPGVRNDGVITARLGRIGLASANSFALDLYGDNLIKLALSDVVSGEIIDVATGKTLKSLVSNGGLLSADGGTVALTASSARAIVDSVINNTGNVEANSVGLKNGRIVLSAETTAEVPQKVAVSGHLSAAGGKSGETGGIIELTGTQIALTLATIDAFGWKGGGTVLVGGDVGGGTSNRAVVPETVAAADHAVANATTVTVDQGTTINASTTAAGDGGKVVLWSDDTTSFAGTIVARGGAQGGDGGFVEVSGHGQLAYRGSVDAGASYGDAGTLLLDPRDVVIGYDGTWVITPEALVTTLASSDVVVTTSAGPGNGDITVATDLNWSGDHDLTLSAFRNITVNDGAVITNVGGANLVLRADNTGTGVGTVIAHFAERTNNIWDLWLDWTGSTGTVSLYYNPASNPAGSVVNGTSYKSDPSQINNPTELRSTDYVSLNDFRSTQQVVGYQLVNTVYDLQNMQNAPQAYYALGRDIDATSTGGWNGGSGFQTIGNILAESHRGVVVVGGTADWVFYSAFSGTFDGLGHTIDGLVIDEEAGYGGLFGYVSPSGFVHNVNLTNATMLVDQTGRPAGLLAGRNLGLIEDVSVSGMLVVPDSLSSTGLIGGLVGSNQSLGVVRRSAANVALVRTPSGTSVGWPSTPLGGLVGSNTGTATAGTPADPAPTGALLDPVPGPVDPPLPPPVYYVMSGTGSVLELSDIAGHSFPYGTFFVMSGTGTQYTPEQLGGVTLPETKPDPDPDPDPGIVHYTVSNSGLVLELSDIAGHSFPFGTFFIESGTGASYTAEQLGGTTLPTPHVDPDPEVPDRSATNQADSNSETSAPTSAPISTQSGLRPAEVDLLTRVVTSLDFWDTAENLTGLVSVLRKMAELNDPLAVAQKLYELGVLRDLSTIDDVQSALVAKASVDSVVKYLVGVIVDEVILPRLHEQNINVSDALVRSIVASALNLLTFDVKGQLVDQSFAIIKEAVALRNDRANLVAIIERNGASQIDLLRAALPDARAGALEADWKQKAVDDGIKVNDQIESDLKNNAFGNFFASPEETVNRIHLISMVVQAIGSQLDGADAGIAIEKVVAHAQDLDRKQSERMGLLPGPGFAGQVSHAYETYLRDYLSRLTKIGPLYGW